MWGHEHTPKPLSNNREPTSREGGLLVQCVVFLVECDDKQEDDAA